MQQTFLYPAAKPWLGKKKGAEWTSKSIELQKRYSSNNTLVLKNRRFCKAKVIFQYSKVLCIQTWYHFETKVS